MMLAEDVDEVGEQGLQKIVAVSGRVPCGACGGRDTLPTNAVIAVPEGHGAGAEIPQDWAQRGEPLGAEDDVVAGQGENEEVGGEARSHCRRRRWPDEASPGKERTPRWQMSPSCGRDAARVEKCCLRPLLR
jgi:hypothetical protein